MILSLPCGYTVIFYFYVVCVFYLVVVGTTAEIIEQVDERNNIKSIIAFDGNSPFNCNKDDNENSIGDSSSFELNVTRSSWEVDVVVDTERVETFKVEYYVGLGPGGTQIEKTDGSYVNTLDNPLRLYEEFSIDFLGLYTFSWSIKIYAIDPDDGSEYNIMEVSRIEQTLVEEDSCIDAYDTMSPTYAPWPTMAPVASGVDVGGGGGHSCFHYYDWFSIGFSTIVTAMTTAVMVLAVLVIQ